MPDDEKIELWKRQYQREKQGRKEAEELLENKSRELYRTNEELKTLTKALEERVADRTRLIEKQRNEALLQASQLQESEKRFQDVIQAAGEYVWETDQNLVLTYLSEQASVSLSYETDDLVGFPLASIFANQSDDDQANINNLIELFHRRKTFKGRVLRCQDRFEKLKWHSISAVPKYDQDGAFTGFRGTGRDISEMQKARDDAIQAARAKSDFFSNMSHEIRTPLNGIVGMSQIMLESNLREDQYGYAKTIKSSADSLVSLINSIFDISIIESGNLQLNEEDFSIDDLVDNCIDYISLEAERKGIRLEVEIADSVPQFAIGDESRLKQSIVNLLHNAVKFTHYGKVSISIYTKSAGANESLAFQISDTGIGISDTDIKTIFKSYEATHSISYEREGGTGLGLAISKGIAEIMGGSLTANSILDSGSVFIFQLPLARSQKSEIKFANKTCRIVSNNKQQDKDLKSRLRRFGCTVEPRTQDDILKDIEKLAPEELVLFLILGNNTLEPDNHETYLDLAKKGATIAYLSPHSNLAHPSGILFLDTPIRSYRLKRALAQSTPSDQSEGSSSELTIKGKHSLVIDDNSINLQVAKAMLAQLGATADIALSGAEGLEMLSCTEYDFILLDIRMPQMNGIEATRAIRSLGIETPIIAVTANAGEGEVETFYQAGMNGYVPKPLIRTTLEKELQHCLGDSQPHPPSSTSSSPQIPSHVFDKTELLSLFSHNLELAQLVASEYSKQTRKLMKELDHYISSRDSKKAKDCLHNLSGSSYNLRANTFGDSCGKLGTMITEQSSYNEIEEQYNLIQKSYITLQNHLNEFLESKASPNA